MLGRTVTTKSVGTSTYAHKYKHYSNLYSLLRAVRVTSGPYKVSDERKKRKTHSNTFKTICANIAGRTELLSER